MSRRSFIGRLAGATAALVIALKAPEIALKAPEPRPYLANMEMRKGPLYIIGDTWVRIVGSAG